MGGWVGGLDGKGWPRCGEWGGGYGGGRGACLLGA